MLKSVDEFEFRPDLTTYYEVSRPCISKKQYIPFSQLLLIRSFLNLDEFEFQLDWSTKLAALER